MKKVPPFLKGTCPAFFDGGGFTAGYGSEDGGFYWKQEFVLKLEVNRRERIFQTPQFHFRWRFSEISPSSAPQPPMGELDPGESKSFLLQENRD